jgi:glycosyltransferase involved in cell wall biosynthesis
MIVSTTLPALVFMWEQFSSYHIDRLEAVALAFRDRYTVIGIEIASHSRLYAWKPVYSNRNFVRHTLFPDTVVEEVPWQRKLGSFLRTLRDYRPAGVFLCNQHHPEILAATLILRIRNIPVFAMLDAKFDDIPRKVLKEAAKQFVYRLYRGGLIAGQGRHSDYYRFLGLGESWSSTAYDTISNTRIRSQAGVELAPGGRPHAQRDFIVIARFVSKKNISVAIRAYALFRTLHPQATQRLLLAGSGALEEEYRALIVSLGADGVVFCGFLAADGVARMLADSLALILPSVEEQWGLVVNEAVALGIPILCSENVGARDTLVRSGVNGFVLEPHNHEGLATCMMLLACDPELWRRMSLASLALAPLGDVAEFVRGVSQLVEPRRDQGTGRPKPGSLEPGRVRRETAGQGGMGRAPLSATPSDLA